MSNMTLGGKMILINDVTTIKDTLEAGLPIYVNSKVGDFSTVVIKKDGKMIEQNKAAEWIDSSFNPESLSEWNNYYLLEI